MTKNDPPPSYDHLFGQDVPPPKYEDIFGGNGQGSSPSQNANQPIWKYRHHLKTELGTYFTTRKRKSYE